ncbi:MAG: hypothetical protein Q8P77_03875 [Candidatus Veblenbacteria bacterium]|nr:hypothetical protein [Candidatus Veblenbacteria bacterium]
MFFIPSRPLPPIVLLFSLYLLFGVSFALGMMAATSLLLLSTV